MLTPGLTAGADELADLAELAELAETAGRAVVFSLDGHGPVKMANAIRFRRLLPGSLTQAELDLLSSMQLGPGAAKAGCRFAQRPRTAGHPSGFRELR